MSIFAAIYLITMTSDSEVGTNRCPCTTDSGMSIERDMSPNSKSIHVLTEDELRLSRLGYKQEAKRIFGLWSNFGLAASMISVLLGVIPLYTYSLINGGKCFCAVICVGTGFYPICWPH